jgi:hypothetical protein
MQNSILRLEPTGEKYNNMLMRNLAHGGVNKFDGHRRTFLEIR